MRRAKFIVLTRSEARGGGMSGQLSEWGNDVACVPLIGIVDREPFPDPAPFDGVLLTSVNAVERAPFDVQWPRVGAVGPVTAAALAERGISVDVVGTGGGKELAEAWGARAGQRLLLPQAADAHPALAEALRAGGAEVCCVETYQSMPLDAADIDLAALERADAICFFAPSQVAAFRALGVKTSARFCAHGATTAAAMHGLEPIIDFEELRADG